MPASECPHRWEIEAAKAAEAAGRDPRAITCPWGQAHFEVTWPNAATMGTEVPWLMRLCVAYGYVPYLITFISFLELLIRRGTRELSTALFLAICTFFNEVVFKNIFQQPRPEHSCLRSCGMPSGHSTMAAGLLTMCLLDTALRVTFRPDQAHIARAVWKGRRYFLNACRFLCKELMRKFSLLPLTTWDELSHADAVLYSTVWFLALLPVPLARVAVNDHTAEQATAGMLLGFAEACLWSYLVRSLQHRYNHKLGWRLEVGGCSVLIHNFSLPRFVAERRVRSDPVESKDPEQEIKWYEEMTSRRRDLLRSIMRLPTDMEHNAEQHYLQQREASLQRLRVTISHDPEEGGQDMGRTPSSSSPPRVEDALTRLARLCATTEEDSEATLVYSAMPTRSEGGSSSRRVGSEKALADMSPSPHSAPVRMQQSRGSFLEMRTACVSRAVSADAGWGSSFASTDGSAVVVDLELQPRSSSLSRLALRPPSGEGPPLC